jgi:hypothetical protein
MKFALLAAPLLLGLAACASTGPESQLGKQDKKPRRIAMDRTTDCAFVSTVQDFEALDDRYIVLYTIGRRDAYLAEITGACFDVRFQSTLATIDGDRNGQICGFGRDSIGYRRLGGFLENCPILGLQKLSNERRLELGIGVPTPRPKKDPKPEDEDPPAESK